MKAFLCIFGAWVFLMLGMTLGLSIRPTQKIPTADEKTVAACYENGIEVGRLMAYHDTANDPLKQDEVDAINDSLKLCVRK